MYSKKDISEYMIVLEKEKCIISFDGIFTYYHFNLMSLNSAGGISNFILVVINTSLRGWIDAEFHNQNSALSCKL